MKDLFARITAKSDECDFSLTVSYLEIYNETIRDLLAPESGPLQLREANGTATPAGLSSKEPTCAADVVEWITLGNQNRTVNATEANATSSRSHAVLSVTVTQKPKAGGMTDNTQTASLSVIDLAGSERASVTKNKGDRLIEGANINRSLLALGNCINALCDPRKRGHVPYRDSKLTRLLKQSLGGNCKTVMIVCVSPSSAHYDETHNTLQYANRAKEIKTKAVRNVVSVDRHVAQYCQQIMEQAARIKDLEAQVAMSVPIAGGGGVEQYDAGVKAVQLAKARLTSQWEQGRDRLVNSERARSQKAGITEILDMLAQWRKTAFHNDVDPAAAPTVALVKASFEHFVQNLAFAASRLDEDIGRGRNALEFYSSMVASQTESIRKNHPQALAQLQLEVRVLELQLESALGEAREFGLMERSKVHARAMNNMLDATVKVSRALDEAREHRPETAKALSTFLTTVGFANQTAFLLLTQEASLVGTKRDAGSRSPLEPESVWGSAVGRKAPRESVAGVGSAPTGALASPMRPSTFNRKSPRKAVSFKARGGNGRVGSASPKKRKEVQWRDEVGDGAAALEDYTSTPDTSMGTPGGALSPMPTRPLFTLSAPSNPWEPTSTSISAAEKMAQSVKLQRSAATGSLRNRASSSRLGLPSLAENGKPFSFLRDDPTVPGASSSRAPFIDLANSSTSSSGSSPGSFSMAGPSGLFAPLVSSLKPIEPETPRRAAAKARRLSQIGPQRSAVRPCCPPCCALITERPFPDLETKPPNLVQRPSDSQRHPHRPDLPQGVARDLVHVCAAGERAQGGTDAAKSTTIEPSALEQPSQLGCAARVGHRRRWQLVVQQRQGLAGADDDAACEGAMALSFSHPLRLLNTPRP